MRVPKPKKISKEDKKARQVENWRQLRRRANKKSIKKKYENKHKNKQKDDKAAAVSLAVRKRDGWMCQNPDCPSRGKSFRDRKWLLHAHHALLKIGWLRYCERFMISLCWECHNEDAHTKPARIMFLKILEKIYKALGIKPTEKEQEQIDKYI